MRAPIALRPPPRPNVPARRVRVVPATGKRCVRRFPAQKHDFEQRTGRIEFVGAVDALQLGFVALRRVCWRAIRGHGCTLIFGNGCARQQSVPNHSVVAGGSSGDTNRSSPRRVRGVAMGFAQDTAPGPEECRALSVSNRRKARRVWIPNRIHGPCEPFCGVSCQFVRVVEDFGPAVQG